MVVREQELGSVSLGPNWLFSERLFPLSLSVIVLSLFTKLVSNLEKLLFLSFFNYLCLLALVFCPIWQQI